MNQKNIFQNIFLLHFIYTELSSAVEPKYWRVESRSWCHKTCGYAATWFSLHRSSLLPTLQLPQWRGKCKLFKTIEIILRRVIPKIQHWRARIELKKSIFWWKQQIMSQIRRNRARLRAGKKLCYSRCKGHHLSRLMTFELRGWPVEAVLTNPHLFFLFDFFSFLFLSLIPSKMGGKP